MCYTEDDSAAYPDVIRPGWAALRFCMPRPARDFRALFEAAPGLDLVVTSTLPIVVASNADPHATMTLPEAICRS